MFKKILLLTLSTLSLLSITLLTGNITKAETYLTNQQITQAVSGLKDSDYVLAFNDGGYISNKDGSANFSSEQISTMGGTIHTVKEFKQILKTIPMIDGQPRYAERGASAPAKSFVLMANQSYTSQAFSGKGWRYSGYSFHPVNATGSYLKWETFIDSGVVVTRTHGDVSIYPGQSKMIFSDALRGTYQWGSYYKTYNPIPGSYYRVSNPV